MNKTKRAVLVLTLLACAFMVFSWKSKPKTTKQASSPIVNNQQTFLLDGFPIENIPLYKRNKVSSNKIFVNTDPNNTSTFDERNFAYFNVVFYTDASQEEFLNYYKNLFESQITDEFENPDMVRGRVGQYKVSAAHYGSDNTGYIQVHLPKYNDESIDKYFSDFPQFLPLNPILIEHEKSYGLLNQKGGEIEFTKYFTVTDSKDKNGDGKDDVDEFSILEEEYVKQYKDKPEYSFDEKSGTMKWKDGDLDSTISISRDHGRIYLMIRKKI